MKTEAVESQEYKGYTIEIVPDTDPLNPRKEFSNLGTMLCFHKRYNLGDEKSIRHEDFASWDEMESHIYAELDAAIVLPIYMYDHSGITISTSPFSCRWDSGQIGFIYVSKETVRKEYGCKRISKRIKAIANAVLLGEVETYDQYLTGSVYGWEVSKTDDEDKEVLDSVWGYFGDGTDGILRGQVRFKNMFDEAKSYIDGYEKKKVDNPAEAVTVGA